MNAFFRQIRPAILAMVVFTVILGVAYPLVVTAIAQVGWGDTADGSLIERDGVVVGAQRIGQPFVSPRYFHPRPSAAGDGYDGSASSGSNLGPTNPAFLVAIGERVEAYRSDNGLGDDVLVPVDAVTTSASGLDPHISVRNAQLQAARVASARGMTLDEVLGEVGEHTTDRPLGILGDPGVNVLELNIALDAASGG
jgi:K+-transporting ATPase ATPase C chain